jgi:hypothetical protein
VAALLITLLIGLLILGIVCVIVNNLLPLDPWLKQIVMLVVVILFLIWLILLLSGYTSPFFAGPRVIR